MTTAAEAPKPAADSAAKTVGRGVMFIGFAKVYFMLTGTVQRLALMHLISPADMGDFSAVNNLLNVPNNTIVQGTIQSISKPTSEDDTRAGAVQRAGVRLGAILGLLIALGLFAAAPIFAGVYRTPRLTTFTRIAALIPFCYAIYSVFVGSANGLRRFRTQASFDVGFSTMKTVLLLGLAFAFGVGGAFAGFVAAAAAIVVIAWRVMRLPRRASASRCVSLPGSWGRSSPTPLCSTAPSTSTATCCASSRCGFRGLIRSPPRRCKETTKRCARSRCCPIRRCWW
jgi:O-antigen/teichoic acid export membrane protein